MGNIRKSKSRSKEEKQSILNKRFSEFDPNEITVEHAFSHFIVERASRGNSKVSIDDYKRMYKKLHFFPDIENLPCSGIAHDAFRLAFIKSLGDVSQQTINHYLRSFRAFGNFCEEQGYLEGFKCPIKEVEPPLKNVYTEKELELLLKEPDIEDFVAYRDYAVTAFILTTGARVSTVINVRLSEVDLESGYVYFNYTKTNKTQPVGLDLKCINILRKYIYRWRNFPSTKQDEFLFCSMEETQLNRTSLYRSLCEYNKKCGVDKTGIHLLRHTFAKMWIQSGGDIFRLAKVLTHSELEMVKRYYNIYRTDLKDAVESHSALSQIKTTGRKSIKSKQVK